MFTGRARQPHTRECRARFEGLLKGEGKVKAAQKRADVYFEKVTGADEERRESEKKTREREEEPRVMTREEVKEDLRKLKKSRVESLAVPPISRRSRRMTPDKKNEDSQFTELGGGDDGGESGGGSSSGASR